MSLAYERNSDAFEIIGKVTCAKVKPSALIPLFFRSSSAPGAESTSSNTSRSRPSRRTGSAVCSRRASTGGPTGKPVPGNSTTLGEEYRSAHSAPVHRPDRILIGRHLSWRTLFAGCVFTADSGVLCFHSVVLPSRSFLRIDHSRRSFVSSPFLPQLLKLKPNTWVA